MSALLDGHLGEDETERAWTHVHACHACRDLVEREGWVKHRLARLSAGNRPAPDRLKGALLGSCGGAPGPDRAFATLGAAASPAAPLGPVSRPRRALGLASLGGGAVGCAVVGVLALGAATPASAPAPDRRLPAAQLVPVLPSSGSGFTPASVRTRLGGR